MFGYELFCVEFFESDSVKYYIESRKNATNQTCPDKNLATTPPSNQHFMFYLSDKAK